MAHTTHTNIADATAHQKNHVRGATGGQDTTTAQKKKQMTMTPAFSDHMVTVYHGDNRSVLATIPDASVDAIVTDPPYELGFMGKAWDSTGIAYSVDLWRECLRVLKPGGHLLAFGGARTYHRLACAVEDAGFEIRDQIMWVYGSGFPKSLDVSKAIDKLDAKDEQQQRRYRFTAWVRSTGLTAKQINDATGTMMGSHYTTQLTQPAIMTREHLEAVRHLIDDVPAWVEAECDVRSVESKQFATREVVGQREVPVGHAFASERFGKETTSKEVNITTPATDAAQQWSGWGTALKPAHEPIVMARKPLTGTVAQNVLMYGTGAINIDGTRIGNDQRINTPAGATTNESIAIGKHWKDDQEPKSVVGRWAANFIHDGSDEVLDLFPTTSTWATKNPRTDYETESMFGVGGVNFRDADTGSAARFFYCAKPNKAERNAGLDHLDEQAAGIKNSNGRGFSETDPHRPIMRQNHHPTVKPLALMRYLIKLVTPPNGTVLDPFTGSGTTLAAAIMESANAIGIELTDEYIPIITGRIQWAHTQTTQPTLFD